ncbi:MAG: hypothetical protein MUO99_04855 [Dehalococcoidales bacterium]|nr:hypothetical protein [Dehalococcoidales bacterium]
MARRIILSFAKYLYTFLILLASDPFDLSERWFGMNYTPPPWLFWILLAVATCVASWFTIKDVRKIVGNAKELDSIKTNLVAIEKYERDAAIKQSKGQYANSLRARIQKDFYTYFSVSTMESIFQQALRKRNIDPMLDFYKKFGDILDANECGLKLQLQGIPQYGTTLADLTNKSVTLHLTKKKVDIVQGNISRVLKGGYGLNSGVKNREH